MIVTGCARSVMQKTATGGGNSGVLTRLPVVLHLCELCSRPDPNSRHLSHYPQPRPILRTTIPPGILRSTAAKADVLDFNMTFPDIVQDLTESGQHLDVPQTSKRLAKVLQYNVTGGKKNRGLSVVLSYRLLAAEHELTASNLQLAQIMGWCLELLHTSMLMTHDTIHGAETRRGKPCWYRTQGLKPAPQVALNDANLLVTSAYQLLRTHLRHKPYYMDVVELFQEVSHKANLGQALDSETRADKTLSQFTMERYKAITEYKTAYHTFLMPVSLALHMAEVRDKETHRQAKSILMEMGQFYQVLADYINCYGDNWSGTDIEDAKCTWLAVVALQRASKSQRKFLEECYGSKDPEKVAKVKELYTNMGLPSTYKIYEEQTYDLICTRIQQISKGLPHKLFFRFLDNIYGRED